VVVVVAVEMVVVVIMMMVVAVVVAVRCDERSADDDGGGCDMASPHDYAVWYAPASSLAGPEVPGDRCLPEVFRTHTVTTYPAPKSPGHQHWVSTSLGRHADAAAARIS